jgi:hypothetical protein
MIFNKINKGSEEVKGIIGVTNLTLNFNNLITHIEVATSDLIEDLLGQATYNLAEEHYLSDNYQRSGSESGSGTEDSGSGSGRTDKDMDDLVHAIQKPIAYLAYKTYAASGDLLHTNSGRQVATGKDTGRPFEWQIERDERNIIQMGFKLQDLLLKYLEDHIQIYPEFRNSESYSISKGLFINTTKDFDNVFPIDKSRRLFIILAKFMREIENKTFKPILNDDFTTLKSAILTNTLTADQKELLENLKPPLVLSTMVMALQRLPVSVMPDGIFQNYKPESISLRPHKPADTDVRREVLVMIQNDALSALNQFMEYRAKKSEGTSYDPQNVATRNKEENKFFRT